MKSISLGLIVLAILTGCSTTEKESNHDILSANIDTSVQPSEDFFQYANGGWLKRNPIPQAESSWGIGDLVQDEIYKRLVIVNKKAVSNPSDDIQKKIANFWTTAMDTIAIEKQRLEPLKPYISMINEINDVQSLIKVNAKMKLYGVYSLFRDGVFQDDKHSESMAYFLSQGGLGLPNRDFYFNTDERTTRIRNEYPKHIQAIFQLYGMDSTQAKTQAKNVFEIETILASNSKKLEALRDPYANYNKYSTAQLKSFYPNINWDLWFSANQITGVDSVIVGQPDFFKTVNKLIKEKPIESWKSYYLWQLLHCYSSFLSKDFVDENFKFYNKTLMGSMKIRPRWKRVLDTEESVMGELLGQAFVKEYFNEKAKQRYINLVESIRDALKDRIINLTWMNDSTKQKALTKLSSLKKKVGYPDKWKDFSELKIENGSYVSNYINACVWWRNYKLGKLGKPVNRDEWDMTPQTYNAYYNPSNNEIVLPAGIFTVPGYRDDELDDALVYGYSGASTIGHEITHGFDDQGRQYDSNGNLKPWWTKDDEKKFNLRAEYMIKQFNDYIPVDTLHINGNATLGENIADLGGILLGWDAFKKTEEYKSGKDINGLSPSKRFFLGYSLGWLYEDRKELAVVKLLSDVHSPAKYRVNGPFTDVDDFYDVFQVKPGDKMYRPDSIRVKIW